jgi:type I restriction enzyme S subunit
VTQLKATSALPKNWAEATIKEVASVLPGYGFPERYQGRITGEIPFFKVKDISESWAKGGIYLNKANNYITSTECRELRAKPLNEGSIVFAKIGEALKLNRRAVLAQSSLVDNNVVGISVIPEVLDNLYAYYFMLTFKLENLSRATTVPSVRKSDIEEIKIPLAPLNEQRRIVGKVEVLFSFLDAGVSSLRMVQAQLKRYRQAVLKAAFEGKLTQQWREKHKDLTKTATELGLEGASESEKLSLPPLPETWTWVHLGQITESMKNGIYKAKSFYDTKGCACLRMYNIENGVIVWKDIKRMKLSIEEIEEYGLNPDDILVNRVNSRELVGKSAVIPEGLEPCVYESKNIRLRLKNTLAYSKYVNYWLLLFGQKYFNRNAQQVVGMASINQTQLESLPLPFCSPLEQRQIIQEIDNHFTIADTSEKFLQPTIQKIESLRQSILKEAFNGRLVSQEPDDEPAEKLLERIKTERLSNKSKNNNQKELSQFVK